MRALHLTFVSAALLIAMAAVGEPAFAAKDTTAPTTPTNLRVVATTQTSLGIAWNASTDNVGVRGYGVYLNGALVAEPSVTTHSYTALVCGKSYQLGVYAYDRARNRSSVATISASTASCSGSISPAPPPSGSFPASYYGGPLGSRNILPPKASGAFLGIWDTGMQQALDRETYIGRRFDILTTRYNAASGKCYNYTPFVDGKSQQQVLHGSIPLVNWSPGFTLDQINAGQADACFRDVARRAAAFRHLFFLRIYHEHNGTWMIYSGCGQKFIDAWRRTVSIFRAEGATNIAWVWGVSEGYRTCAFQSYPGDQWVDWVATGGFNHNKSTSWCGYHAGWCEFWEIFRFDPKVSLHDRFGPSKPIMFTETGSKEDTATPGRKGQWFRLARDKMRSDFVYGKALVYFDILYTDGDWRVNTSQSAYEGFRDLARDPHFNTR
jgi:hypothetical protein